MKTKRNVSLVALFMSLFISTGVSAQEKYSVVKRVDNFNQPTTFYPTKATPVNGAINENVVTSAKIILNNEKPFLKKGVVKTVGEDKLSAWQMTSDEGGNPQSAPNPLTYFTAGAASDLLTQVERSIQIMGLDVKDVKVETEFFYRWSDIMTDDWSGYTDKVVTNIVIKSNESVEKIKELKKMAVRAWAIGESLENKTPIDKANIINGDDWDGKAPQAGQISSPVSTDNGRTITNTTAPLKLETIVVKEDANLNMNDLSNDLIFSEVGIAESAHDAKRPYLHKLRAKSLTTHYETWELYSDDSRGYEGINAAPTSREYFTLGTSFCLMSQLAANFKYFAKKGVKIDDFGVEHQFNYRENNFMTPAMTGEMTDVVTRIIVKSAAAKELANQFAVQSLRCCFAGDGIVNETPMETSIYLNGKLIK
ncbi:OsmC family protein [Ancylomarina sp. 16SWW S1-10-2]|uniref:OsmC family protein n=1 Tax=Ancylomarina sp. 16SWW S1-10-2 TaxID=2499681 RepID=UPI0012AD67B8|nr:OsmC family protein [Ancylomarina sp. 16SWW S1-10-2]MRT92603.1 OsmC family peroxiredoxin [Ancylomarina sp. 16SWW S1-10-2]